MSKTADPALPLSRFPDRYSLLLQFYDVVDKLFCFLKSSNSRTTGSNLYKMVQQLGISIPSCDDCTDVDCAESLFNRKLAQLAQVCPSIISFSCPEDDQTLILRDYVFEYIAHSGITNRQLSIRRLRIVAAFSTYLCSYYIKKELKKERIVNADIKRLIKEIIAYDGWPNSFNVADIQLPVPMLDPVTTIRESIHQKAAIDATSPAGTSSSSRVISNSSKALEYLKGQDYKNQIAHIEIFPSRPATFAPLSKPLPDVLTESIKSVCSIESFYSHQATAIDALRSGAHLSLSTSTSSGKSAVYNIPVLESILTDNSATALYIFPTKALAQDQLRSIGNLCESINSANFPGSYTITAGVCDGDTKQSDRQIIRENVNIILSNPDMLHVTMLPGHIAWRRFFENLKFVVIDEAHHYTGAFGANVAALLTRLVRVCLYHTQTIPQFVCCSATISNPGEHMNNLVPLLKLGDQRMVVLDSSSDGSPIGERHFVIWKPPLRIQQPESIVVKVAPKKNSRSKGWKSSMQSNTTPEDEKRTSSILEMANVFSALVGFNLRTLAFCRTRKLVELVLRYSINKLTASHPKYVDKVASYRGGYNKEERRDIECNMFNGNLRGIVATCALELGIDIGSLDCTLHLGFPGSYASLWQQAGRAGRNGRDALSIIVCFDSPIDMFFARNPDILFHSSTEAVVIDPGNEYVLRGHLLAAANELPLNTPLTIAGIDLVVYDSMLWAHYGDILHELSSKGLVYPCNSNPDKELIQWRSITRNSQDSTFGLRTIDPVEIKIIDSSLVGRDGKGTQIDSIGYSRAFFEVFEGAIYLHKGKQYMVTKVDLLQSYANCTPVNVDYYTMTKHNTRVNIVKVLIRDLNIANGTVQVVSSVYGYRKIRLYSGEIIDSGDFTIPPMEYNSRAMWIEVPVSVKEMLRQQQVDINAAVHAINHSLLVVAPVFAQCDSNDLACEHIHLPSSMIQESDRILIYDKVPGGLGISDRLYDNRLSLLDKALNLIESCNCPGGCTGCLFDSRCTGLNDFLDKQGAIMMLQALQDFYRSDADPASISSSSICADCQSPIKSDNVDDDRKHTPRKRLRGSMLRSARLPDISENASRYLIQPSWTAIVPQFSQDLGFHSDK